METYMVLNKVTQLFKDKNYITKIGSKLDVNDIAQNLMFINPINKSEQYIINILDKNNINVTIPLKNTNYAYKTKVTLENLLNYVSMHTS